MRDNNYVPPEKEFDEKSVEIKRVSKKTKGGNKVGFTALMVVGDKKGRVGVGLGKATDVASAIRKGTVTAKKNLVTINMTGTTIAHEIRLKLKAARIMLKPAPAGTGVIAGGPVRAVVEAAGIKDVVAKILGSNNKYGNVLATFAALQQLKLRSDKKGL
jgi:small subunit ribosomal protein S5